MKRLIGLLVSCLFATVAANAQTQQVVGPNGIASIGHKNDWIPFIQGNGFAQVTTTLPCGTSSSGACSNGFANRGDGSLELKTTGNLNDWAYYYLYKQDGFGTLHDLTSLSFDWYRTSVDGWNSTEPADWIYKTPAFRLLLAEERNGTTYNSELVWEGYYNLTNPTTVDTWVRQENMQVGNFWYVRQNNDPNGVDFYSQNGACNSQMTMWEGNVNSTTFDTFLNSSCLVGANVSVVGVGVGVGSAWPLRWEGAVDNIRMDFGNNSALNTNFDYTVSIVPEPSTYLLTATGLFLVGIVHNRRRNKNVR